MTVEQTAENLVRKYHALVGTPYAKYCAILAVDEIIESGPSNPHDGGYYEIFSDRMDEVKQHWEQVKEEINKL